MNQYVARKAYESLIKYQCVLETRIEQYIKNEEINPATIRFYQAELDELKETVNQVEEETW